MRYRICMLWLMCLFAAGTVLGQGVRERKQAAVVPRELSLPVVAVQPGSPLEFEEITGYSFVGGGGMTGYRLHNRGTKPIRSYMVADCYLANFGCDSAEIVLKHPLLPGDRLPRPEEEDEAEDDTDILPLTDELRAKVRLQPGPMTNITVIMVVRVKFTDGTMYSDEKTFKAVQAYMEKFNR